MSFYYLFSYYRPFENNNSVLVRWWAQWFNIGCTRPWCWWFNRWIFWLCRWLGMPQGWTRRTNRTRRWDLWLLPEPDDEGYWFNKIPGVVNSFHSQGDGESAYCWCTNKWEWARYWWTRAKSEGNRDGQLAVLADHSSGVSESFSARWRIGGEERPERPTVTVDRLADISK